jgi:hypothetical protein
MMTFFKKKKERERENVLYVCECKKYWWNRTERAKGDGRTADKERHKSCSVVLTTARWNLKLCH